MLGPFHLFLCLLILILYLHLPNHPLLPWHRAHRLSLLWGTGLAAHARSFSLFCVDAFFLAWGLMP